MPETKVPRWKMTVLATGAVYPISLAAESVLLPELGGLPMAVRDAVIAVTFSAAMTYVTMPALSRALRGWLSTERRNA
ncbi:hypothetical protein [Streptomyces sp. NPDC002671]